MCRVHDNVIAILCQSGFMESWPRQLRQLAAVYNRDCAPSKVRAGMSPAVTRLIQSPAAAWQLQELGERSSCSCHQKLCHSLIPPGGARPGHATLASRLAPRSLLRSLQLTMTAWSVVISSRDDGTGSSPDHPLATFIQLWCFIGRTIAQGFSVCIWSNFRDFHRTASHCKLTALKQRSWWYWLDTLWGSFTELFTML